MTKPVVEVYARKDCSVCSTAKGLACSLCFDVRSVISKARDDIPFQYKEIDICSSEDMFRRFKEDIPTVFINGKKAFKFKVDESEFRKMVRKEIIRAGILRLSHKKEHYS